jgi:hypothetical protein
MNLNPDRADFMSSSLFVYEAKRKRLATIHFAFYNGEPQTLDLVSCTKGPRTFQQLLDELNRNMAASFEKVTMLCVEDLSGPKKVGEFGAAHLTKVFPPSTMREVEKAYTTILKDCFSA